jgi:hypothetical protein
VTALPKPLTARWNGEPVVVIALASDAAMNISGVLCVDRDGRLRCAPTDDIVITDTSTMVVP